MSPKDKKILERLQAADEAYYVGDEPLMSDAEYDSLKENLKESYPNDPYFTQVGSPVNSPLSKVSHSFKMGSLDKVKDEKDLVKWLKKCGTSWVIQPKLDGLSVALQYENGKFVRAVTRGNGEEGEDVTHNVTKGKIPAKISGFTGTVRCEVILPLKIWQDKLSGETKNPRNAASGILRRLDSENCDLLEFVAIDASIEDDEDNKLKLLANIGFQVVDYTLTKTGSELSAEYKKYLDNRHDYTYEIDGMVIKVNDLSAQKSLSYSNLNPNWAIAWKFPPSGGFSVLRSIEWSLGSQQQIVPTANFDPVELCGATVSRASLYNVSEISRLNIGVGDEIEVIRANDVIPKIIRVVRHHKNRVKIEIPKACPVCQEDTVADDVNIYCTNITCEGVRLKKLENYAKKRNILGLGDELIKALHYAGLINTPADLFTLTPASFDSIGYSHKLAVKVLDAINASRSATISDVIGSLGIDLLGRRECENLVDLGFDTLEKLTNMRPSDLMKHKGYGIVSADRICSSIKTNLSLIKEIAKHHTFSGAVIKQPSNGKAIIFTGTMSVSRSDFTKEVTKAGFTVQSSLSRSTDILVVPNGGGEVTSKMAKAKQYGTKIMEESEFRKAYL